MKLEEIDLSKGEQSEHPDFNTNDYFLVKKQYSDDENPSYYIGHFDRQWYGWNFSCGFGASGGFQYDKPGYNSSGWKQVWKLIED
jgi:hypothetical protein